MTVISSVNLAGEPLSRCAHERSNSKLHLEQGAQILFYDEQAYYCETGQVPSLSFFNLQDFEQACLNKDEQNKAFQNIISAMVFMGRPHKSALFSFDLGRLSGEGKCFAQTIISELSKNALQAYSIFELMSYLPAHHLEIVSAAQSIFSWHKKQRFCGYCGGKVLPRNWGWTMSCAQCNETFFPRIDLAVIMSVEHEGRLLLGRPRNFPEGLYSHLSGFVEPGETIEAAVRRETLEEAGVLIGDVSYFASQPWPFPTTLMIACAAKALTDHLHIDFDEMDDVCWFSEGDVLSLLKGEIAGKEPPRTGSVARFMLETWLQDRHITA